VSAAEKIIYVQQLAFTSMIYLEHWPGRGGVWNACKGRKMEVEMQRTLKKNLQNGQQLRLILEFLTFGCCVSCVEL
jgi:hypothetical protein